MARRELRIVKDERVIGAVVVTPDGTAEFEGRAASVLQPMRRRFGDREAARQLMTDGWANGYIYLAPEGAP